MNKIKLPISALAVVVAVLFAFAFKPVKQSGSWYRYTDNQPQNSTGSYVYSAQPPSCDEDNRLCAIFVANDPNTTLSSTELNSLLNTYGNPATGKTTFLEEGGPIEFKQ